jgi:uroporphyrinogen III methyltransferase/synthase
MSSHRYSPRVLVTRARGRNGALIAALQAGGATPIEVPLLAFEATRVALPDLADDDILAFTSATAVELWTAPIRGFLAAVGPSTAAALRARGVEPDLVPDTALASELASELARSLGDLHGRRVIYPRAEKVPPGFERALREAGATVVGVPLYRTVLPPEAPTELAAALPVELVTLASGSAARHLAALGPPPAPIVVIGPSTRKMAEALGLPVAAMAEPHTAEGLAAAALALLKPDWT